MHIQSSVSHPNRQVSFAHLSKLPEYQIEPTDNYDLFSK